MTIFTENGELNRERIIFNDNGTPQVQGNRHYFNKLFREIHRRPPSKYGFFKNDELGTKACTELINKFNWRKVK